MQGTELPVLSPRGRGALGSLHSFSAAPVYSKAHYVPGDHVTLVDEAGELTWVLLDAPDTAPALGRLARNGDSGTVSGYLAWSHDGTLPASLRWSRR
jgi:hypothetical protein